MLVDEFLPVYDVSDSVATVVQADVATAWDALMEVDLIEVGRRRPLVTGLNALRALPEIVSHVLHGELPARGPKRLRLRDTTQIPLGKGGWMLLGEHPQEEIALGLVGKFWRPAIAFAKVTAEEFRSSSEPGFAKTVYSLSVRALDKRRTLLTGVMRTATNRRRRAPVVPAVLDVWRRVGCTCARERRHRSRARDGGTLTQPQLVANEKSGRLSEVVRDLLPGLVRVVDRNPG
jgi:hypothetical protein